MTVTTCASAGLIAINDGTVQFDSTDYAIGYGAYGDNNYINKTLIDELNLLGDDVIIKLTMGIYTDYFKPVNGATLSEMLTTHTKHLWTSDLTTPFVAPNYWGVNNGNLGGSANNYPSDGRIYLPFWGTSYTGLGGGCCEVTAQENAAWGRAFKMESINVPEPSTLAIFALGMIGLASRRFKKQS